MLDDVSRGGTGIGNIESQSFRLPHPLLFKETSVLCMNCPKCHGPTELLGRSLRSFYAIF